MCVFSSLVYMDLIIDSIHIFLIKLIYLYKILILNYIFFKILKKYLNINKYKLYIYDMIISIMINS